MVHGNYNINGKLLKKIKLSNNIDQQIIPLAGLKNGIYLFRLHVDNKIIDSKKVTVIK